MSSQPESDKPPDKPSELALSIHELALSDRAFAVTDRPCPRCDEFSVLGYYLLDQEGGYMHTRYVCTFWRGGLNRAMTQAAYEPCGWSIWGPGWSNTEFARGRPGGER
jgi:hypothetical protein